MRAQWEIKCISGIAQKKEVSSYSGVTTDIHGTWEQQVYVF